MNYEIEQNLGKFVLQETHFPSYFRHIEDENLLSVLCDEIQELKGRLRPMVCFYEEFDKNPLNVWKRIENGEHFREENCLELLEILKKKRAMKRKMNDESSSKRIKLEKSSSIEEKFVPEVQKETRLVDQAHDSATALEVQKYLNATKSYFNEMTSNELRKIKVSIKLAEELSAQDVKPTPDLLSSLIEICDYNTSSPAEPINDNNEELTESEINTLIDNFETLKSEDQNNLISFLQKLEIDDPEKFKNLH